MWNIGFGELAVICIVLIIAVGPERLPSMMKTVGKTVRTLRQASRDLRESTGIDELLREDFDYRPPLRKPEPPVGPAIARDAEPVMDPTTSPLAPLAGHDPAHDPATEVAAPSLPSDGPLTAATAHASSALDASAAASSPLAEPAVHAEPAQHANVGSTLPSDAPLESNEPPAAAPVPVPPVAAAPVPASPLTPHEPVPQRDIDAKPRES